MSEFKRGDGPSDEVERIQHRLIAHGFSLHPYGADGRFGRLTEKRVREFQRREGMIITGVVAGPTRTALESRPDNADDWAFHYPEPPEPPEGPPRPSFPPLTGNAARHAVFGHFKHTPAPTPSNPEAIKILGDWTSKNIVNVEVPQLAKIPGIEHRGRIVGKGPKSGRVFAHRLVADQLKSLWQAWEDEGLLDLVLTWAGMWVPRYIRGSRSVLSNHAFGSAFDICAPWNALGAKPAGYGKRGSVMKLVPLAHEHGWGWGGHFRRTDSMHFEFAKPV